MRTHRPLVTGGAGLVGSRLVESLGRGEGVFVIDDLPSGHWESLYEETQFPEPSICSTAADEAVLEYCRIASSTWPPNGDNWLARQVLGWEPQVTLAEGVASLISEPAS